MTGTLRGAMLPGARQGLSLAAGGNVYITGVIDAAGAAAGQTGGAVSLAGRQVLVTGAVTSAGADATPDGTAGAAIVVSAQDLFYLGGTLRLRGGAAYGSGNGGPAGTLAIDGKGAVQIAGVVDARGGFVPTGGTAGARAGAAGALRIGETTRPAAVEIAAVLTATGGNGPMQGGAGGTITLEPRKGNLAISSSIDAGGGLSAAQPGAGGTVIAVVGEGVGSSQVDGGDIDMPGTISANGGGIVAGGNGDGAEAGVVTLEARSYLGALTVAGSIAVDGGASHGATRAGGGGHVSLFVQNGDLTIAGHLSGRGGAADEAGGTGGLGGQFNVFSDNNFDGYGGNLTLDTTGVIDASGGAGAIGGSARNDGRVGVVAAFPDDREMIAVLLNCDGIHGGSHNWMVNRGWIVARGGAHNGNGGDVAYHGITSDGNKRPPSGNIDLAADGIGVAGDYRGE